MGTSIPKKINEKLCDTHSHASLYKLQQKYENANEGRLPRVDTGSDKKRKERCEYITAQPPYLFYFFFSYNPLFLVDWHMQTS